MKECITIHGWEKEKVVWKVTAHPTYMHSINHIHSCNFYDILYKTAISLLEQVIIIVQ